MRRTERARSGRTPLLRTKALCVGLIASVVVLTGIASALAASSTTKIRTAYNPNFFGRILEGPARYTLYVFCGGTSSTHCMGAPTPSFKREIAHGRVVAASGSKLKAKKLGTRRVGNGQRQVTYYGQPLYLYKGDRKPGQVNGEEKSTSRGAWFVIGTSGRAIARGGY